MSKTTRQAFMKVLRDCRLEGKLNVSEHRFMLNSYLNLQVAA